ncbi:hypothetical protein OS493_023356 [Desmophyllum pertusum]|uniref:ETS domain-containing protein n=1 Tax=Desmophyllum pertusum TaxID=174260 RepID=A0A9X0D8F8_9CNID|nr:hypothetical protein OS493_023356 [Desmophyllum pertusum]
MQMGVPRGASICNCNAALQVLLKMSKKLLEEKLDRQLAGYMVVFNGTELTTVQSILKDQGLGSGDLEQILTVLVNVNEENLRIEITSIQAASVPAEEPPKKRRRSSGSATGRGNTKAVQLPTTASQQVPVISCANSENNMQGQQISVIKNGLENSTIKDEPVLIGGITQTNTSFSLKATPNYAYMKHNDLQAYIVEQSYLIFTVLNAGLAGIASDPPTLILHASPQNSPGELKSPPADAVSGDDEDKTKSIDGKACPGNRSGNNGQIQLWQFLLELLTDRGSRHLIMWVGENGEFKLNDPEQVAQQWGQKKKQTSHEL